MGRYISEAGHASEAWYPGSNVRRYLDERLDMADFWIVFDKYFDKSHISLGSLLRKSLSLMVSLAKRFKNSKCEFMLMTTNESVYEAAIFIDDLKYVSVLYFIEENKNLDNIRSVIRSVITRQRYLRYFNNNYKNVLTENKAPDEEVLSVVLTNSDNRITITRIDKLDLTTNDIFFGYSCMYDDLTFRDKVTLFFSKNKVDASNWTTKLIWRKKHE